MKIFFPILLFLNLTGTYRVVAAAFGIPVSIISTVILTGLILWSFLNIKYMVWLFKKPIFNIAFFLILFWPISTLCYAIDVLPNRVALQLYYFLLFTNTIIFLKRYDISLFARIISLSYWTAVTGLFLSFLYPDLFTVVAEITSAKTDYYGRAFGFMLQPNMAITNLSLLFVFHMAFANLKSKATIFIAILSYLFCVLLTGSRTGIVIMLMIFLMNFSHFFRAYVAIRNKTILFKRSLLLKISIITIVAIFSVSFMAATMRFIETNNLIKTQKSGFGLKERLNNFLNGKLSTTEVSKDGNLQARFEFQKLFMVKFAERPLAGFGMGSRDLMLETGELLHPSHSQLFNYALEYGIIYCVLFFGFFCMVPLFLKKRGFVESFFRSNWILQMTLVISALSVVSNTVLTIRTPWPLMGALFFYLYLLKTNSADKIKVQ